MDVNIYDRTTVARDYQQLKSVRVNCSSAKKSSKKVLTFDATNASRMDSTSKFSFVLVQSNSNFPDQSKEYTGHNSHMHQVMRPIIYEADESLRDLSPAQRNCYFQDERKLKFFNVYTKHNCFQECLANATLEFCQCARFFQIRDDSTTICHATRDRDCTVKIFNIMHNEDSANVKQCDCLPSCSSIDYNNIVYLEKFKGENNSEGEKASMSVYFAGEEFIVMRRYASFGTVTLLSNVGGLLGLFLGASIMSFIEVFYFFVIRLVNNLWWKEPA